MTYQVKPHAYVPSSVHLGDCAVCGQTPDSGAHEAPYPSVMTDNQRKAQEIVGEHLSGNFDDEDWMPMVERVARGICRVFATLAFMPDQEHRIDGWCEANWERHIPHAEASIQAMREPEETAPKGVPVIVQGGLAMKKTGGQWFTGMEEPLYQRPLQWTPEWWMQIPTDDALSPDNLC